MPKKWNIKVPRKTNLISKRLFKDVKILIDDSRYRIATAVNSEMTNLYWNIGSRIRKDVLKYQRGPYGQEIVLTLSAQLGWSHFLEILQLDDPLKRNFYTNMCKIERWSVRTLREERIWGQFPEY